MQSCKEHLDIISWWPGITKCLRNDENEVQLVATIKIDDVETNFNQGLYSSTGF